jgi:hypothetical protein
VERRPLLVIAGWLGAAALALLVGLGAISVIGSGLASSGGESLSEAEVRSRLASSGDESPGGIEPPPGTSVPPASTGIGPAAPVEPAKTFATRAGTVTARCAGSQVEIVSMSPAQGYAVHERESGRRAEAEGEFRGTGDDHDRVEVRVRCGAGEPVSEIRSERD